MIFTTIGLAIVVIALSIRVLRLERHLERRLLRVEARLGVWGEEAHALAQADKGTRRDEEESRWRSGAIQ